MILSDFNNKVVPTTINKTMTAGNNRFKRRIQKLFNLMIPVSSYFGVMLVIKQPEI